MQYIQYTFVISVSDSMSHFTTGAVSILLTIDNAIKSKMLSKS